MKYITALLIIGIAVLASSCAPSLHPLYTDKDLIFEPALLGEWVEAKPDSKSTLTFSKTGDKEYKLRSGDPGDKQSIFIARLVKLGDKLFLDHQTRPGFRARLFGLAVAYVLLHFADRTDASNVGPQRQVAGETSQEESGGSEA